MTNIPYSEGDIVALEHQYRILRLKSEIPTSWLFEGQQLSSRTKVLVKVFNNNGFSNITDVEIAWKNEIESLKLKIEIPEHKGDFIESGVITEFGEKKFIIIYEHILILEKPGDIIHSKISSEEIRRDYPPLSKPESEDIEEYTEDKTQIKFETPKRIIEPDLSEEISETKASSPTPTTTAPKQQRPSPMKKKEMSSERSREKEPILDEEREEQIEQVEWEKQGEQDYLKHIAMEYFDRMNPQNYYPLTINISDIVSDTMIPIINPITGERKVQKLDEMDVTLYNPIVKIRPSLPGCNVEPNEIKTDFTYENDEITFYITPLVKGKIQGQINFINDDKIIHSTNFNAKVVDPKLARAVAFYGILTSFIPEILSILGINLGLNKTLTEIWSVAESTFGNMTIASLIALGGIVPVVLLSIGVRQILKAKSCKVHYKLRDFRMIKGKAK